MNTQHTPGPWEIADILEDGSICMMVGGGKGDVHITHWPCPIPLDEREANARLIAAAPELLDALQECITSEGAACFGDMQDHPERMQRRLYAITDIARAAIAKATQP